MSRWNQKIIVPSDWDVKSEATTVFGGVEDKRAITSIAPTAGKTLIIEGNCFLAVSRLKTSNTKNYVTGICSAPQLYCVALFYSLFKSTEKHISQVAIQLHNDDNSFAA